MTRKMLAVALMSASVLLLAGCNKTPDQPVIDTGDVTTPITGEPESMNMDAQGDMGMDDVTPAMGDVDENTTDVIDPAVAPAQ